MKTKITKFQWNSVISVIFFWLKFKTVHTHAHKLAVVGVLGKSKLTTCFVWQCHPVAGIGEPLDEAGEHGVLLPRPRPPLHAPPVAARRPPHRPIWSPPQRSHTSTMHRLGREVQDFWLSRVSSPGRQGIERGYIYIERETCIEHQRPWWTEQIDQDLRIIPMLPHPSIDYIDKSRLYKFNKRHSLPICRRHNTCLLTRQLVSIYIYIELA